LVNRVPFLAAVTFACVLAAILLLEYRNGVDRRTALTMDQSRPASQASPAPAASHGATPGADLAAAVRTILERPLFSPSRRPGQAAVVSTALPRLAGIIIGPHGARAIFAGTGDGRAIIAGPGAHAGPYLIRDVSAAGVSVIGPNGPQLLHPSYDRNPHEAPGSGQFPVSPGQPGTVGGPSILDLLRSRVQNGEGLKPSLLPPPNLQTAPGARR
jgi:hypothetical protein